MDNVPDNVDVKVPMKGPRLAVYMGSLGLSSPHSASPRPWQRQALIACSLPGWQRMDGPLGQCSIP